MSAPVSCRMHRLQQEPALLRAGASHITTLNGKRPLHACTMHIKTCVFVAWPGVDVSRQQNAIRRTVNTPECSDENSKLRKRNKEPRHP